MCAQVQSQQVTYGIWSTAYLKSREVFSEKEARRRHDAGEEYYVWWGDPASPDLLMHVDKQSVGVIEVFWLDAHSRWLVNHVFVPEDKSKRHDRSQRLFLEQARHRSLPEFDPENPRATGNGEVTYFEHDGSAHHERVVDGVFETMDTPALPPQEAAHILFDSWPQFGDWARITRPDRDK